MIWAIYWIIIFRPSNFPPGPTPFPFLGTIWFEKKRETWIKKMKIRFGPIMSLSIQRVEAMVVVNDFEFYQKYIKPHSIIFGNRPYNPLYSTFNLDKGIIFSNGNLWKTTRKFSLISMKNFGLGKNKLVEDILTEADLLVNEIDKHQNLAWDPSFHIMHAIANVISTIVFNKRFEYDDKLFSGLMKIIDNEAFVSDSLLLRVFNTHGYIIQCIPMWLLKNVEVFKFVDEFITFTKRMIEESEKKYDPNNPRSVIDLFIKAREDEESKKYLRDHTVLTYTIIDLFGAGADTTANTIRWALKYLCQYPKIQDRVYEDIVKQVGKTELPNSGDINSMPYFNAFLHEVLRKSSLVSLGVEHCTTESIKVDKYTLPKETTVFVNQKSIHEDTRYWKDALNFSPSNFLDGEGNFKKPTQFMPFGWGRRACLGELLAKMEKFLVMTRILQKFSISFPEGDINMNSRGDIMNKATAQKMIFTPRL